MKRSLVSGGLLLLLAACAATPTPSPVAPTPTSVAEAPLPTATIPAPETPTPAAPEATPTPAGPTAVPTVLAPALTPPAARPALEWTADDERWAGRSIYFMMTDRFSNGDPSNDAADGFASDPTNSRAWHGGDFAGIQQQLDYIAGMGFGAIWITPVTLQRSPNAYHGYWQYDLYQIDGHFGTLAELQALVEAAHARDILVMIDVVPNHTGDFLPGSSAAPPFDPADWYHNQGNIANYGDQQEVEQGDLLGLDDLNQENPATRQELLNWIQWLKQETGLDGLRVDTAKHMPQDFLAEFDAAAQTFTLGEVFNGDIEYVAEYSHALDAVLDYPFYYGAKNALLSSQSARNLAQAFSRDELYRNPQVNGLFLDNHDVERFLCLATGGPRSDKQTQLTEALKVLFTVRGLPIVYYGTEQSLAGCNDPANREDMPAFDQANAVYQTIADLNTLRSQHPALLRGDQTDLAITDAVWAFQRTREADAVIVCVNATWKYQSVRITTPAAFGPGVPLFNALETDAAPELVAADGSIACDLAPREVKILVVLDS